MNYDDGTDILYELVDVVDGSLVKMGAESDLNTRIAFFLLVAFSRFVPLDRLRNKTEIETPSRSVSIRYPDFVVLSEEGAIALSEAARSMVRLSMLTLLLVGEVVSSGAPGKIMIEITSINVLNMRSEASWTIGLLIPIAKL